MNHGAICPPRHNQYPNLPARNMRPDFRLGAMRRHSIVGGRSDVWSGQVGPDGGPRRPVGGTDKIRAHPAFCPPACALSSDASKGAEIGRPARGAGMVKGRRPSTPPPTPARHSAVGLASERRAVRNPSTAMRVDVARRVGSLTPAVAARNYHGATQAENKCIGVNTKEPSASALADVAAGRGEGRGAGSGERGAGLEADVVEGGFDEFVAPPPQPVQVGRQPALRVQRRRAVLQRA